MGLVQVGIEPSNCGHCAFLNWFHDGYQPQLRLASDQSAITGASLASRVDGNFDLSDISGCDQYFAYHFVTPVSATGRVPNFAGLAMTIDWQNGAAVTGVTGLGVSSIAPDLAHNKATFTLTGGGNTAVYLALDATKAAPTAIRIYETGKASQLDTYLMDPDWIAFFSRFGVLRMMDCMATNNSEAVDYANLPATSFALWSGASIANGRKVGWPAAALAEIANRTGKPIWINIPHQFTDAAVTSLLTALRDAITYAGNEVRLYIEYSNEVWNGSFAQNAYSISQGGAAGWTSGNSFVKGRQWTGYRAAQIMEIARTVFSTDSGAKWSGVLATQHVSTAVTTSMLTGVAQHISSDAGAASVQTKLFSDIAHAWYFAPTVSSDSTEPGLTLNSWLAQGQAYFNAQLYSITKLGAGTTSGYGSLDDGRATVLAQKAIADANGFGMRLYEAGYSGETSTGIQNTSPLVQAFVNFADSWQCAQNEFDLRATFKSDTAGMPAQFTANGPHSKFGSWGARERFGDYASERANALEASNLGIVYLPGKSNMRVVMTSS